MVRSNIKEKGRYKVIDKISVDLNDKKDVYQAQFSNLGLKEVLVDSGTVKKHPKLLVGGVWCIADLEYEFTEDKSASPWILSTLKPIQLSHFDFDGYVEARKQFTTDEWIDLLVQSIGFNPEMFGKRSKLTQLVRLIPFCERNYNLIELGPKGTGKSHIYSEFSPHGKGGAPKDEAQSFYWLEKGAQAGDRTLMGLAASYYRRCVNGAPKDLQKSLHWYQQLAATGDANAERQVKVVQDEIAAAK